MVQPLEERKPGRKEKRYQLLAYDKFFAKIFIM